MHCFQICDSEIPSAIRARNYIIYTRCEFGLIRLPLQGLYAAGTRAHAAGPSEDEIRHDSGEQDLLRD